MRRATSGSDFSTPKRSSDAWIDPTEGSHEALSALTDAPPRRRRWGAGRLVFELQGAPKRERLAERSIGDGAEADASARSSGRPANEAIGASQRTLCVDIDMQRPHSGFSPHALGRGLAA